MQDSPRPDAQHDGAPGDSSTTVDIVVSADAIGHRETIEELATRSLESRNLTGRFVVTDDLQSTAAALSYSGDLIVVPGVGQRFDASAFDGVVRVDFGECAPDRSPGVRHHIRGRGIDGIHFAVESVYHHRFHRGIDISYGDHPDQCAVLRIPSSFGPFPVAVLVHGGYWRARWQYDLMDALAVDLTRRGYATWNVEYRRPDEHNWYAMTSDIAQSLQTLQSVRQKWNLDLDRIVTVGHSAGGQLVLRLAADSGSNTVRPALTVSLAGVLDLRTADERWLSEGAVSSAIGGRYAELAATYDDSSPVARLPIGCAHLIACGVSDDSDLLEISRSFSDSAAETTDVTTHVEGPGGHFDIIDPTSEIWATVAAEIDSRML